MLQQFYKDTLQSQYIKYILNNFPIPTVPFTSNIMHVTKGNTYIHDGYFVTAKKSDAVAAIKEDIKDNSSNYYNYFKKGEPYIFGEHYNGLTTTYKSNTKGYDSTSHYYLGEYLRAYKAYYNIDLMPFYNCYSNEYIDYVYLDKDINGRIFLKEKRNQSYSIISVPIKFCQNYTIALQCNTEVRMLPVLIGKKGILQVKTSQLNQIDYWGKSFSNLSFKSPVHIESPHINSVNDATQAALQTYDKYLRLLIQIPANVNTSIVVLEGKYSNTKPFQERIFNTDKNQVESLWKQYYTTKIPSNEAINIPKESTVICSDLSRQKLFLYGDNTVFSIEDDLNNKIDFKFTIDSEINNDFLTINTLTNSNNRLIRSVYQCISRSEGSGGSYNHTLKIPTDFLCQDFNFNKNNGQYNVSIIQNQDLPSESSISCAEVAPNKFFTFTVEGSNDNSILWKDFNSSGDPVTLATAADVNGHALRQIVAVKKGLNDFSIYACELAFYLDPENDLALDDSKLIKFGSGNSDIDSDYISLTQNNLKIKLYDDDAYNLISNYNYIQISQNYPQESTWVWDLKSLKSNSADKNFFSAYLNQNLISNLSLLLYNDGMSYAFSGRLLEYLINSVISSNEKIAKNISRVQKTLNLTTTDIYGDDLRIDVYKKTMKKAADKFIPYPNDLNGFLDKDSENILSILNEVD